MWSVADELVRGVFAWIEGAKECLPYFGTSPKAKRASIVLFACETRVCLHSPTPATKDDSKNTKKSHDTSILPASLLRTQAKVCARRRTAFHNSFANESFTAYRLWRCSGTLSKGADFKYFFSDSTSLCAPSSIRLATAGPQNKNSRHIKR